jgi:hypothetical protein
MESRKDLGAFLEEKAYKEVVVDSIDKHPQFELAASSRLDECARSIVRSIDSSR